METTAMTTELEARKEVLQSYLVTSARYDFSVYEKRILYRIVELIQQELSGKSIGKGIQINGELFGGKQIIMQTSNFLVKGDHNSNSRIKKAFTRLVKLVVEEEHQEKWVLYPVLTYAEIPRGKGVVKFEIHPRLYRDLLNFAKGYSQYELQIAFSFRSQYTMRLYELTCKQRKPITYSISRLREIFCLENRYSETSDFIKKVIDTAQKELEASKSTYYFTYKREKQGRSIVAITFYTHYRPEYEDPKHLKKRTSLFFDVPMELVKYLNDTLQTTNKNWIPHREVLSQNRDISRKELDTILEYADCADNPVGYVVNAFKKRASSGHKKAMLTPHQKKEAYFQSIALQEGGHE